MSEACTSRPLPETGPEEPLREFLDDTVGGLMNLHRQCGDSAVYWKGETPLLFVFGPEFNRDLLSDKITFHVRAGHPGSKGSAQRSFRKGLFALNGDAHTSVRRLYQPSLRKSSVESYAENMSICIDQVASKWRHGQVRDLVHEMKTLGMNVTGRILFGLDDLETAWGVEAKFDRWFELNHKTFFTSLLPLDGMPDCYQELLDAADDIRDRIVALLDYKRQMLNTDEGDGDLLGMLVRTQMAGAMTQEDLVGQMLSLFNAAHHTSTYSLTWTLFLLAQHPEVAGRLLEELDEFAPDEDVTLDQLKQCSHLERIIKESLRILSPIVYLPRETTAEARIGPYRVPAGTLVVASEYVSHHRAADFPNPELFRPDRWLESNPGPYSYFPFGAGPRMCIGSSFALQLLKIATAKIIRRFRFSVMPGTRIDRQASLSVGPRGSIPILIQRQDGRFATSPVRGQIHEMVNMPIPQRIAAAA